VIEPLPLEALPPLPPLRLAVVGHLEVVSFVRVDHLPVAGEILHARGFRELPAGGGPVVAMQLAKLTGSKVPFFTALGRDPLGERAAAELAAMGLEPQVAWREAPTRRGVTFLDGSGERTITVIGERLTPTAADPLPWEWLAGCDGVFVTAADGEALRLARRAGVLAATPRLGLAVLAAAGVRLDALIGSGLDPGEAWRDDDLPLAPGLAIRTEGARGGVSTPGGRFAAPLRRGPVADTYGAGDSFAAGVTGGLAAGWSLEQALSLGCHCGAACVGGEGPYEGQLVLTPPEPARPWPRG
jgi:ribokinase